MELSTRALIVDDDADARLTMALTLQADGIEVETADSGDEAWKILCSETPPPIVLVDWVMPGEIDGPELCRRIRRSPTGSAHYVILVTARKEPEDLIEGLSAGADDFMAKPFDPVDLLARIRIGQRTLEGPSEISDGILAAIGEARRSRHGEVVVRSGEIVGRVLFRDGDVYWAYVSTEPEPWLTLVQAETGIDPDEEAAVLAESRKTGRDATDVLLDWGLVDRARLRSRLRSWIRGKLKVIFALEDPQCLFLPTDVREGPRSLGFKLGELYPEAEKLLLTGRPATASAGAGGPSRPVPLSSTQDPTAAETCRKVLEGIPNSGACVVFDLDPPEVVASAGGSESLERIRRSTAQFLTLLSVSAPNSRPYDEAALSGPETRLFVRRIGSRLIAVEAEVQTSFGLALMLLRELTSGGSAQPGAAQQEAAPRKKR